MHKKSKVFYETDEYSRFILHKFNRNVETLDRLIESMESVGYCPAYPISVFFDKEEHKLVIRDGHHRFKAAQKLNLPVIYALTNVALSIKQQNETTRIWDLKDYLESGVRIANPNYIAVSNYMARTGISIGQSIALLAGESAGSKNHRDQFMSMIYTVKPNAHADQMADIIPCMRELDIDFYNHTNFVHALSKVLLVEEVSLEDLKQKLTANKDMIKKQTSLKDYVMLIEEIYNKRRKAEEQLPLAFMSERAAKMRQGKFYKKAE